MTRHVHVAAAFALISFAMAGTGLAADPAIGPEAGISQSLLTEFGLAALEPATDTEASKVRGKFIVYGTPGSGFFVTDVPLQAILHAKAGKQTPGQVWHDLNKHTTTILYNPKFGTKTVPNR